MEIVFESLKLGCLCILAVSAIVFPTLFLVQFSHFRKEIILSLNQHNADCSNKKISNSQNHEKEESKE